VIAYRTYARALPVCLPRQGHVYITANQFFRFHTNKFNKMPCKLDSTENPHSFEKYPTQPWICIWSSSFHNLYFFCRLAQYCLSKITIFCMGESDTAPTHTICCRVSCDKCPRPISCRQWERLVQDLLGQPGVRGGGVPRAHRIAPLN